MCNKRFKVLQVPCIQHAYFIFKNTYSHQHVYSIQHDYWIRYHAPSNMFIPSNTSIRNTRVYVEKRTFSLFTWKFIVSWYDLLSVAFICSVVENLTFLLIGLSYPLKKKSLRWHWFFCKILWVWRVIFSSNSAKIDQELILNTTQFTSIELSYAGNIPFLLPYSIDFGVMWLRMTFKLSCWQFFLTAHWLFLMRGQSVKSTLWPVKCAMLKPMLAGRYVPDPAHFKVTFLLLHKMFP